MNDARGNTATVDVAQEPRALRIPRSYYFRPDQVQQIDDACLDLPAVLREKLSPSKVMERFVDDRFAEWVAWLKAGSPPAPTVPKKSRNGKRDQEGG